jgi:carbohydrate kinase (thermoresistant glucokinase family)
MSLSTTTKHGRVGVGSCESGRIALVVMGVCCCGKSTVGSLIAARAGCQFLDADAFHSEENVQKMNSGIPLTDGDRWDWLACVGKAVADTIQKTECPKVGCVLACSALKQAYRRHLEASASVGQFVYVHLQTSVDVTFSRLQERANANHILRAPGRAWLDGQFSALEPLVHGVEDGITIGCDASSTEAIVAVVDEYMQSVYR